MGDPKTQRAAQSDLYTAQTQHSVTMLDLETILNFLFSACLPDSDTASLYKWPVGLL